VAVVGTLAVLHFLLKLGLGVGQAAPDLLTLALLIGARELSMGAGAGVGFFFGLLEDSFSVLAFGGSAVAMTLVGAAGSRTRDLFVGDSLVFLVSYLFFGKWVRDLLHWLVVGEGVREPFTDAVLVQAPIAAIYLAVVGVAAVAVTGAWWDTAR
jgi:cell shape-determining protein MreD